MIALVMCMQWTITDGKISRVIQTFENPSVFNALFMTMDEAVSIRRGFFIAFAGNTFLDKDSAAAKETFEKYCDPSFTIDLMPLKNIDIFKVYTGLNELCTYRGMLKEYFDFEGPYVGGIAMINVRQMHPAYPPLLLQIPVPQSQCEPHIRSVHSDRVYV